MGKSSGAAPQAPDPEKVIPLQTTANKETFDYALGGNRYNQITPTGSQTWTRGPATGSSFDQSGYDAALARYNTPTLASPGTPGTTGTTAYESRGMLGSFDRETGEFIPGGNAGSYPGSPSSAGTSGSPGSATTGAMPNRNDFMRGGSGQDQWTLTNSLSPNQQKLFDANESSQTQQAQLLAALTQRLGGSLSQPLDYSSAPSLQTAGRTQLNLGANNLPQQQRLDGGQGLANPQYGQINRGAIPSVGGDPNAYNRYGVNTGSQIQGPGVTATNNAPGTTVTNRSVDPSGRVATPGSVINDRSGALSAQLGGYQNQLGGLDAKRFDTDAANAVYNQTARYLDPQVKSNQQALEARLAEQGFVPGTPGYQKAMEQFQSTNAQSYADARDRATTQGFSVGSQQFGNNLQGIQSQIASALSGANFGLSNDQSRSAEGLNRAEFTSGQNQQDFNQRLAGQQFGAGREDALFGQRMSNAQFGAGREDAQFSQGLAGANFRSGEQQNQFGRDLAGANLGMSQDAADFTRRNSAAGLQAQLQGQDFDQQRVLSEQQRQTGLDANSVSQQLFQNRGTAANFNNAVDQQQFQNRASELARGNDVTQRQQQMDLAGAGFNNQARQQAIAEMLQQRSQPLNELNAIRSGTQVNMPSGTPQGGAGSVQPTDVMGAYNQQYQGQLDKYNADVGSQNSLMGLLGQLGLAGASFFSDARLKENIRYVGKTNAGANIYHYRIFDRVEYGVLAQELLETQPEAVSVHPSGFYVVDYSKVQ